MNLRTNPLIRIARRGLPVAFGLGMMVIVPAAQAWSYAVTDLGPLGGNGRSWARGISTNGQVVGVFDGADAGDVGTFLYSNGTMTGLAGTLGGDYSIGYGINDAGQVTGSSQINENSAHAFLYSNGTMTDLGTLGGDSSIGNAINNAGQVTGQAGARAFLYSDGVMTDLGTFGGNASSGYGISANGQVTGYAETSGDVAMHAFLYSNGVMTDLGTLGGNHSWGYGINDAGQVAGYSFTSGNSTNHAFLYSNGVMTDLGALGGMGGDDWSHGYGINAAGQVVGATGTGAFLYSNGVMTDLNTLIDPLSEWRLHEAIAINDAGQIVGSGLSYSSNQIHAFLLTPVPEPETYVMLLAGLAMIGFAVRRRGGLCAHDETKTGSHTIAFSSKA